ncbi:Uncharacterized protein ECU03_1610 [Durusdinium trenchii]|uniref:Uncharacterized protein ECU03_1610 n=1 Tax=Durusdinium trenchii TaxID=1381693 RepID=A0ABP0JJD7_9DINO
MESGKETASSAIESGKETVSSTMESGRETASNAMEFAKETASSAMESGKETASNAIESGKGTVSSAMEPGKEAASNDVEFAKETASSAMESAKETTSNAAETVSETATDSVESGKETASSAMESAKETASNAAETVKDAATSAIESVQQTASQCNANANANQTPLTGRGGRRGAGYGQWDIRPKVCGDHEGRLRARAELGPRCAEKEGVAPVRGQHNGGVSGIGCLSGRRPSGPGGRREEAQVSGPVSRLLVVGNPASILTVKWNGVNRIDSEIGPDGARKVAEQLENNETLEMLE